MCWEQRNYIKFCQNLKITSSKKVKNYRVCKWVFIFHLLINSNLLSHFKAWEYDPCLYSSYIYIGYRVFRFEIYLLKLSFENHFIPDYDDWWNYFCIRAHNGMVKVSIVLLQNRNHHRLTIIPPIRTRSHIKSCNIVCAMRIIL